MLKDQLNEAMKAALRGGDKRRLGVLRLALAAIKQKEVDERVEVEDADVLAILDKMVKQRRESAAQYEEAGRADLYEQEVYEVEVLTEFMPQPLSEDEISALINEAISESGANGMQDMGKVMGLLQPKARGRADMKAVSAAVRARLSG